MAFIKSCVAVAVLLAAQVQGNVGAGGHGQRLYNVSQVQGGSLTNCTGDADCPSSYCMKGDGKSPPFTCHDCGDNCCNSDLDCPTSYCMQDQTKKAPYSCHGSVSAPANATEEEVGKVEIVGKYCTADADCTSIGGGYCEKYKPAVEVYLCHGGTASNDYCVGDGDCNGGYCQNGATKTPVKAWLCH